MTVLVIDGNNLAHRCRHVFSLSYKGKDVSVTFGFLKVIDSLLAKFHPTSIMVCWDWGIPEYRRTAIPEYKAQRDHGDPLEYEGFLRQLDELTEEALPLTGILSVRKQCTEADDLCYHAAKMMVDPVLVISSDKDLIQVVDGNVKVYNPARETIYTREKVKEEFGISYENYVDWRALQGDSSDNIPGVYGIGEKTATKLFQEYKTLTGITNAALGINPNGVLGGRLSDSLRSFGFDRISRNIFVMALYADRTGSRLAIEDVVYDFHPADSVRMKKYFMRNGFSSLVLSQLADRLKKLQAPRLKGGMRTPVVCCKRIPA